MKGPTKKQIKATLYVASAITLVTLGVAGTLKYQSFIEQQRRIGEAEFRMSHCDEYTNEDKSQRWLECDIK